MTDGGSVVLIGSRSTVAVAGFKILQELGISVPLVISGDEDPGADDWRLSLAKAARDAGYNDGKNLLVLRDPHQPEVLRQIRRLDVDLILSLQWRRILRQSLRPIAPQGIVNLHNAPLPLLRGCDPFSWAIHDGLETMGVTLHQVIDDGVDTGPILAQRLWPISEKSTAWQLYCESLSEAELLMRDGLKAIAAGKVEAQPQAARYASYHPLRQFRFSDLEVDWRLPAVTLSAQLRARIFPPFQLPYFCWQQKRLEILQCHAVEGNATVGEVVDTAPLRVAARRGAIQITKVRLNGEDMSDAALVQLLGLKIGQCLIEDKPSQ